MELEGVLFEMFPIPIGMGAGIGSSVLAIIAAIPAKLSFLFYNFYDLLFCIA
jgi:hypothetical protein